MVTRDLDDIINNYRVENLNLEAHSTEALENLYAKNNISMVERLEAENAATSPIDYDKIFSSFGDGARLNFIEDELAPVELLTQETLDLSQIKSDNPLNSPEIVSSEIIQTVASEMGTEMGTEPQTKDNHQSADSEKTTAVISVYDALALTGPTNNHEIAETAAGTEQHQENQGTEPSEKNLTDEKPASAEPIDFELSKAGFEISELPDDLNVEADAELISDISNIPDRLAFKIGDVADIVGIKQYVLRYWETEFEVLKPKKSRQNQRMYTKKDIENVLMIKKLLYRDKFSIEGARKALKNLKTKTKETKHWDEVADRYEHAIESIMELKASIQALKSKLQ